MRWVTGIAEMTKGERISWVCLHILVASVPLAVSNFTWLPGIDLPFTYDMADLPKAFLLRALTLVAVAGLIWHLRTSGGVVRTSKYDPFLLGLLLWFALATVLSIHWPSALLGAYTRHDGALAFVNYVALWFVVLQLLDRMSRVRSLARTLVITGAIVGLYGLVQYVGADPVYWGLLPAEEGRAFSTFSNPILLGGYLLFPLLVAPALALSEKEAAWRAAYWVAFTVVAACWVAAMTRSAWLGGALGLVLLAWTAWRQRIRLEKLDLSFMGAALGVLAAAVLYSLASGNAALNVWQRVVSAADIGAGSTSSRVLTWGATLQAIQDRPVTGFGPDSFGLVFPQYRSLEMVQTLGSGGFADNAHNYVLQLAVTIGIPGALALMSFILAGLVGSFRHAFPGRSAEESHTSNTILLAGFWAASAAYLVHLMLAISVPGSTFLLWLSLAALVAPAARTVEFRQPTWFGWASLLMLVAIAGFSVMNISVLFADHHFVKVRSPGQYTDRLAHAESAVRLNPLSYVYRVGVGEVHMDAFRSFASQADEFAQRGADPRPALDAATGAFTSAEQTLRDAIDFIGPEYQTTLLLVTLYNMGGERFSPAYHEEAKELARQSLREVPFSPEMAEQYALALFRTGDTDEAERQLLAAIEMDPRLVGPHALLGDLYRELGEVDAAREHYLTALSLSPDDEAVRSALDSLEQAEPKGE